jgi:hypothetical protein
MSSHNSSKNMKALHCIAQTLKNILDAYYEFLMLVCSDTMALILAQDQLSGTFQQGS